MKILNLPPSPPPAMLGASGGKPKSDNESFKKPNL